MSLGPPELLPAGAGAPSQGVRRRVRRRVLVVTVVTCSYLAWLIIANHTEIDRAILRFRGTKLRWLVFGLVLEGLSQGMSVIVQHRLLRRAGTEGGVFSTARLVLAQSAIGMAIPGGPALAAAFSFSQIRRRGTTATVALWVVTVFNVIGLLAVVTFGVATATGVSLLSLLAGSLLVAVLAALIVLARSPQRLRRPVTAVMRLSDRLRRRSDPATLEARVDERLAAVRHVRLHWHDWLLLGVFALAAVAADCGVWFCASHAVIALPTRCLSPHVGAALARRCAAFHYPSTAALLIAYSAGQGALALPIVPGGLGLVESIMTASLTATKVRAISALSAVLLYRFISFWTVLLVGGGLWIRLHRQHRATPPDPHPTG